MTPHDSCFTTVTQRAREGCFAAEASGRVMRQDWSVWSLLLAASGCGAASELLESPSPWRRLVRGLEASAAERAHTSDLKAISNRLPPLARGGGGSDLWHLAPVDRWITQLPARAGFGVPARGAGAHAYAHAHDGLTVGGLNSG